MISRLQKCQRITQYWWKKCAEESPLYLLGVVLQPHLRMNFLPQWCKTYGEELVDTAKDKMCAFWEKYQQSIVPETPQPSPPPSLSERSPSPDGGAGPDQYQNESASIVVDLTTVTSQLHALDLTEQRVQPSDEFRAYLEANLEFELVNLEQMQQKSHNHERSSNLSCDNFPKIPTIIQWWYKQRHRWPMLSNFAMDILSIPAMTGR